MSQFAQLVSEIEGGRKGIRVVLAEDPALAREGVFVEVTGGLEVSCVTEVDGEAVSESEGEGMVFAERAAAALEGVLIQRQCCPVVTQAGQGTCQVMGRAKGHRVVFAEDP